MLVDVLVVDLLRPSVRKIRDRKLDLLDEWEAKYQQPGEAVVQRGYDVMRDAEVVRIMIRPAVPRGFNWSRQA